VKHEASESFLIMAAFVGDVDRIVAINDPILRNLQITQCYHEISLRVAEILGGSANWCTFATWASKQAGQTIRREDLVRAFEERFLLSSRISALLDEMNTRIERISARIESRLSKSTLLRILNPTAAFGRASDAVARGNLKVFAEIGREFARFIELFAGDSGLDPDKVTRFRSALRPGEPPDGQRMLGEAFQAYCETRFQTDAKKKVELMLLANLRAGFHEQIRLQPEIAESLNAPFSSAAELKQKIIALLLPGPARQAIASDARLFAPNLHLDEALARLYAETSAMARRVITEALMTLHLPGGETLRLGSDLQRPFPPILMTLDNSALQQFLAFTDATPNSLTDSGARDWADFKDRMHFITDFFRSYQEMANLFDAPFTPAQVAAFNSDTRPHPPSSK
jgi:hypothetical protein